MRHRWLELLAVCVVAGLTTAAEAANTPDASKTAAPATTAAPVKPKFDPHIGSATGLPLPRFVSLRADAVNMRVGPGDAYPIQWVYHRVGLPVEVLREYDVWRLVVDVDGTKGWVHEATLVGGRRFVVIGQDPVVMRHRPLDSANAEADLMPGVIGSIERCDAGAAWCRVRVAHHRGWLPRAAFWGSLPGEEIH
jgi:SH3-like domain-containing protein